MSSMFKKKGGPAFKPKIPSARSRPAARPAPTPTVEVETPIDEPIATPPQTGEEESIATQTEPIENLQDKNSTSESADPSVPVLPSEPAGKETSDQSAAATKSTHAGRKKTEHIPKAPILPIEPLPTPEASAPTTAPDPVPLPQVAERVGTDTEPATDTSSAATPATGSATDTAQPQVSNAPTRSRKNKAPALEAPATAEQPEGETSTRPKKRQRKTAPKDGEAAPKPRQRKRKTPEEGDEGSAPRRRRGRSLTPEDAELQTVDLQQLKMADLTKDLHIGKKFSRHDELRERERQRRLKAKLEKNGGDSGDTEAEGIDSPRAKEQSSTPSATPAEPASQAPAGPQFRIVDGQIVVDQNSLAVDRHARAAAARAGEDMETIEENDFTRLITSNSFMNTSKLRGPNVWTDAETVLFYRGLAMFGTDFEIISKMIPGKQRRHVKLKFNREERHCPRRVNAALVGEKTVAMDMEEYKAATGAEFESVESIAAEQQKIEDGYEAERQRIADEQAEVMRKKKEELFADEDVGGAVKKKKKGKKKKVEYGLNGEPIATDD